MKIRFSGFGQAGSGEIKLRDLTVICGPNSSGKTYTSYAIYAIYRHFSDFFEFGVDPEDIRKLIEGEPVEVNIRKIKENLNSFLDEAGKRFVRGLDRFFNAPDGFFRGSEFSFEFDQADLSQVSSYNVSVSVSKEGVLEGELSLETGVLTLAYTHDGERKLPRRVLERIVGDVIYDSIFVNAIPTPFVVTSERTGVSLFYKDLDYNSNAIISQLRDSGKIDPLKMIESMRSRYAKPIQDNIDTVRDYDNLSKRKSFLRSEKEAYGFVFEALSDLLGGGAFRVNNGQLSFSPRKRKNKEKVHVPLYIASSSIKSLFLLDLYINFIAQKGQLLIIDEPELNLHPDNQVKVARLIARLVNSGVKVLLTTHSDYIVREINNLVSLSAVGEERGALLRQYGLCEEDILSTTQVGAYSADANSGLTEMSVSESGVDTMIFDSIIAAENRKAQDIFLSIGG